MAFCRNCGTQLVEGALFCSNCGTRDVMAAQVTRIDSDEKPRKPGLGFAISSMVLSIFGLLYSIVFLFLTGEFLEASSHMIFLPFLLVGGMPILATIFAAVAMKRGWSNGFSKAGLTMGLIGTVINMFVVFLSIVGSLLSLL